MTTTMNTDTLKRAPHRHHYTTRCVIADKPGVGRIHMHTRRWSPNTLLEMTYEAPGGGYWTIPDDRRDAFTRATSSIEAMAILRNPSTPGERAG